MSFFAPGWSTFKFQRERGENGRIDGCRITIHTPSISPRPLFHPRGWVGVRPRRGSGKWPVCSRTSHRISNLLPQVFSSAVLLRHLLDKRNLPRVVETSVQHDWPNYPAPVRDEDAFADATKPCNQGEGRKRANDDPEAPPPARRNRRNERFGHPERNSSGERPSRTDHGRTLMLWCETCN